MSGLYGTLQLGQRAVQTQRQGIELAGHNIANVDNPAFARQRIDVATGPTIISPDGIHATGVTTEQVQQVRNQILDTSIQQETSITSYLETKNTLLEQSKAKLGPTFLANLANGSGEQLSGIAEHLNGLFDGFQELANDVTSRSQRVALVGKAEALARDFNQVHQGITHIEAQISKELEASADDANGLLGEIARLNQSIEHAENRSSSPAHDLRDRRLAKLEELSKLANFQTSESETQTLSIHLDGETILEGANILGQFQIAIDAEGKAQAVLTTNDTQKAVTQGRMGALGSVASETLGPLAERLDQLASAIIGELNQIHQSGFGLEGSTGEPLFVGNNAATIAVNQTLIDNPDRIQASSDANAIGDNTILRALSGAARNSFATLDGQTLNEHLAGSIGSFVEELADTREQLDDQTAIQDLLQRQRNAVSGVSLDEEMTNLVKYQNAFEASARLVSVIDEMLQTVVNLGRS